jgi:acyl-CoA thioester hydrolase
MEHINFIYQTRVYYSHTDAGGIVYHPNYLTFAEHARTEWLRSMGINQSKLTAEHDCIFVVRKVNIEYRAPARLDDLLTIEIQIKTLTRTRIGLEQVITVHNKPMAKLQVEVVVVNNQGQPKRLPEIIVQQLRG